MKPPNGIIMSMKSRNGTDQPALVFYALIGNDVCSHHHDFDHMTTVEEFEQNVLASLDYLDANLAPNSYVVFISLADGRVLYNTMSKLIHPIGTTYAVLYDYLNCLDTSPCWGWMNGNETVRDMTSQRAMDLSAVYQKIIKEHNYKNFKMHYIYADIQAEVDKWVAQGHQARDLIEPVDGFHPSQTAEMLTVDTVWQLLENELPDSLGPVNPNNDKIGQIFGNQGGY
jgi:acyloxyacyl hydrolase